MATKKAMRTRTDVSNDIENSENASLRRSSRSTKSAISENSPKSPPSAAPKTTMDLMPSELSAIFCNRGAGKRQPKLMSAVVLPSMIKLSGGDNDDEDDDFHVQEEELEVESESSDADDGDDQTDKDESSARPKRGGGRSAAPKHQLEESDDNEDDDDEQIQNGLGSDEGSSDDELTLDQTLDKYGKQQELTSVVENIGTTTVRQPLICAVCLLTEGELDEYIVQCDKCGVSVHEMCYGDYPELDSASDTQSESSNGSETEPWFCATCLAGLQEPPLCELCPTRGGIYKRTDCNKWIHVVCGLYIHQVSFGETERLENACLQVIPYQLWGAKQCMFCEDPRYARSGICVQCDAGRLCKTYFHPTCGQKMGFLAEPEASESPSAKRDQDASSANEDGSSYIFFSFCKVHSDSDTVKSRQRAYKALQKQIANFTCCMTGKIERQLERQSANYIESRKNVDPWFPETPSQKLLSSRPELARTLTRKAEELGKIHKAIPLEYTVNVTNKWYMAPAFDVNFAAYFQDRERRLEELGKSIVSDVKKNKALKEELEDLEKQLRKVTYVVDSMQLVVDKRVNQMISATQHLRSITNFEYSLPVTCTSTLELLSKQLTSKKSNTANPNGAKSNVDSNDVTSTKLTASGTKETTQSAEDDEIIIVLNMCEICKLRNNQHLVIKCDSCKLHYHINCLDPPLSRVPKKGEKWLWQCKLCCPDTTKVQVFEDNLPRRRKKTVLFGAEQKENESSEAKEKGDEVSEDKEAEAKISEKSEPIPIASPPNVESSPEVPLLSLVIPRAEDVDTKWSKVIEKNPIGDSQKPEELKEKVATSSTAPSMFLSSSDRSPQTVLKPKLKSVVNPADVFDFDDSDNEAETNSKDQVIEKLAVNRSISVKQENKILEQKLISTSEDANTRKAENSESKNLENQHKQTFEVSRSKQAEDTVVLELESTKIKLSEAEKNSQVDIEQPPINESSSSNIHENNDLNFNISNEFCDETLTNSSENSTTTTSSSSFETVHIERNPTAKPQSREFDGLETSRRKNTSQERDIDRTDPALKQNINMTEARSQSSDEETVEFVGSGKKLSNEDLILQSNEKSSSYKPNFVPDDLVVNSESPTNAGLNALPKSSPLDLIDKWASESDHNATTPVDHFSFEEIVAAEQTEGSSTPILTTEIEQDSDNIDSDRSILMKNKESLSSSDKPTSSKTENIVSQSQQMKQSNENEGKIVVPMEVPPVQTEASSQNESQSNSLKSFKNELVQVLTHSTTTEHLAENISQRNEKQVPDKKSEETAVVQEVQYREITKISPEGEPVIVRIPIRPKNRPQQPPAAPPFQPAVKQDNSSLSNETSNVTNVKSSQVNKNSTESISKLEKRNIAKNERNSPRTRSERVKEPMLSGLNLKALVTENSDETTNNDVIRDKVPLKNDEKSCPKETLSRLDDIPKVTKSAVVNGGIRSGFKPDFSRVVPLASEAVDPSASSDQVKVAVSLDTTTKVSESNISENDRKRKKKSKSERDLSLEKANEAQRKEGGLEVPSKVPKVDKIIGESEKSNLKLDKIREPNNDESKIVPGKLKNSELQNSVKDSTMKVAVRSELPAGNKEKVNYDAADRVSQKVVSDVQKPKLVTNETKVIESSTSKSTNITKYTALTGKLKAVIDPLSKNEDKSPVATFETPHVNQKQPKSKIQLLDDLFNGPEAVSGASVNTSAKPNVTAKTSEKKDKMPIDKEKNVKKIESISYAPRHKVESQTRQLNEQPKEKEVPNSVEASEKNLHSKRPSVNHFKIPKNRKIEESKTSKADIAKEYGAKETKLSEPPFKKLALEKPLNEVQRRTLADDLEINKPKPPFPRDAHKSKLPERSRAGTPTPSIEDGLASPTSAFAPVPSRNLPQTKEDTFKRKIGQLMEFTGSFSESRRTPHYHSGDDDDDEYDPTSNFKVEVPAPRSRSSDSFSNQQCEPLPLVHGSKLPVPPGIPPTHTRLPLPLPPPTGYSFDDFDYDRPPTPPPGLFDPGKSAAVPPSHMHSKHPSHNIKPNVLKETTLVVPRTAGGIGTIPPPIKMVPPGRAAREGVKLTAVEPKVDKRPPIPSAPAPQHNENSKHVVPTNSTPQAKRKKDFNQYLQENRARAHKHQPKIIPTERVSTIPIDRIEEDITHEQSKRRSSSPSEEIFSVESHQVPNLQSDPKMSIEASSVRHGSNDKAPINETRSPIDHEEEGQRASRSGTPVMDESADPLIIRSTDPNDPASNFDPTTVPLSPNATMKLMQVLLDQNFLG